MSRPLPTKKEAEYAEFPEKLKVIVWNHSPQRRRVEILCHLAYLKGEAARQEKQKEEQRDGQ